jgi:branched-chain amino acid transport system permease protein
VTREEAEVRIDPAPSGTTARLAHWLPDRLSAGIFAVALAAAVMAPLFLDNYLTLLANLALVYAIIGIGLTVVLGWTGQFAFISTGFFGLGAYTGGRIGALLDLPIELALLVGLVAGLALGVLFGAAAVRLRGYYLSIVTIAFLFLLDFLYRNLPDLTGGVRGFVVPTPYVAALGGLELATSNSRFYFGLLLLVAVFAIAAVLRRTAIGRAWQALRANPQAAAALGVDVYRYRLLAFAVSAGIFAVAGVWFAYVNGRVFPETYTLGELIFHFLIVVIGGMGSLRGAVVAAVALVVVREYLRGFVGFSEIFFGGSLLIAVLFFRSGIYGTIANRWRRLREDYL